MIKMLTHQGLIVERRIEGDDASRPAQTGDRIKAGGLIAV